MEDKKFVGVLLGEEQVGKTSWADWMAHDVFFDSPSPTVEHKTYNVPELPITLELHDILSQESLRQTDNTYAKKADLLIFVWDASRPETHEAFYNKIYYLHEAGIDTANVPMLFVACKADVAVGDIDAEQKAIFEKYIDVFQLNNTRQVITSAKSNLGKEACKAAVCTLLRIKKETDAEAAIIAALNNLNYTETTFAHTRVARFASLNVPGLVGKNPKQLTLDEFEWLLRQWKTINDRKSTLSLWIERRLAYKVDIYTDPLQPYSDAHKKLFDAYLEANPIQEEPKVDRALTLLSRKETGIFIKIGCFFSSTYLEKIKEERLFILQVAFYLNSCAKLAQVPNFASWGPMPEELNRIINQPRLL